MTLRIKAITCLLFFFSCSLNEKNTRYIDKNLVVPGKSAEGYNLDEKPEMEYPDAIKNKSGNIQEIIDLKGFPDLRFNSFLYYKDSHVVFMNDGIVTGIAGFKMERRITSDAVSLSRGIDNFILNYGNNNLSILSRDNNRVYIYKEAGIALFDDYNDNTIDIFLIFKK